MNLFYVPKEELDRLDDKLDALRLNVLYMVQRAGGGHLGGSLSSLMIMYPLFFGGMGDDDVFITSKGHDAPALYACMQAKGTIPFDTIHTLRRPDGLPGHPTVDVPGVLFNTGSLGMGISKANGLALSDRMKGVERKIHVLVGDGELQEGQNWEAWSRLSRLAFEVDVHVDANGFGLSGRIQDVQLPPNLFIHHTPKGAGISFMENDNRFHAGALTESQYKEAVKEILDRNTVGVTVEVEHTPPSRPAPTNSLLSAYSSVIYDLGRVSNVIVMDADLEPDCGLSNFRKAYPDRFIQCGIAEQDMVSMATGLSAGGFTPIVHSFASFLCRRANEQIYNACLERRHIVFVGHLAGMLPVGPGTSHECLYDVELMKTMPGMTVLVPDTPERMKYAMEWAVNEATGPVYVSIRCWELEGMRR